MLLPHQENENRSSRVVPGNCRTLYWISWLSLARAAVKVPGVPHPTGTWLHRSRARFQFLLRFFSLGDGPSGHTQRSWDISGEEFGSSVPSSLGVSRRASRTECEEEQQMPIFCYSFFLLLFLADGGDHVATLSSVSPQTQTEFQIDSEPWLAAGQE